MGRAPTHTPMRGDGRFRTSCAQRLFALARAPRHRRDQRSRGTREHGSEHRRTDCEIHHQEHVPRPEQRPSLRSSTCLQVVMPSRDVAWPLQRAERAALTSTPADRHRAEGRHRGSRSGARRGRALARAAL